MFIKKDVDSFKIFIKLEFLFNLKNNTLNDY